MKTNSTRTRLELEAEAHRALAMEMHTLFCYLDDEELEEFCAEFVSAPALVSGLDLNFVYAAACAVAEERREKLARLRSAFDLRGTKAALSIAREVFGKKHNAKSNRTNPCIH